MQQKEIPPPQVKPSGLDGDFYTEEKAEFDRQWRDEYWKEREQKPMRKRKGKK